MYLYYDLAYLLHVSPYPLKDIYLWFITFWFFILQSIDCMNYNVSKFCGGQKNLVFMELKVLNESEVSRANFKLLVTAEKVYICKFYLLYKSTICFYSKNHMLHCPNPESIYLHILYNLRVIFTPYYFHPSIIANSFALSWIHSGTICLKRRKLKHWNSSCLKFSCWQQGRKGRK